MKALFLLDTLKTGGAEKSILQITSNFKEYTPIVCTIYKGDDLSSLFKDNGIPVYFLDIEGRYNFITACKKLTELLTLLQPDVIHATLIRSELIARIVAPKLQIPLICSFVNDSYSEERYRYLPILGRLKLSFFKWVDRITAKRVTAFMSITHAIIPTNAKALNIDASKIEVIHRGRSLEDYDINQQPFNKSEFKNSFGEGPVFLSVARLLVRKGYIESISAFLMVIKSYPNAKYLIAGEGHDRLVFEKLIKKLDLSQKVFLLGNRSDIPNLLRLCDYFVFPSHYEGQGGALIEAMLLSKPIIASQIEVVEESVKNQDSAILFELRNVEDLASKMIWAIDNSAKAREIGKRAREVAEKKFNIKKIATQHELFYTKTIIDYKSKAVIRL